VIESYKNPDHEIIGAFMDDILVGCLGICKVDTRITIRHISVVQGFQRQGFGTLLLNEIKKTL
jgi:GNAT superfamily N-acetyltransferase